MAILELAVPAIIYMILFAICLGATLIVICRDLPHFEKIWLYPIGFIPFRMVTMGYFVARGFGAKEDLGVGQEGWWAANGLQAPPPGWIAFLGLGWYASIALFAPLITIAKRRYIHWKIDGTKSYRPLQVRLSISTLWSAEVRLRVKQRFIVYFPSILGVLGSGILVIGIIDLAMQVLQLQHASGQPSIHAALLKALQIANPVIQIAVAYLSCAWLAVIDRRSNPRTVRFSRDRLMSTIYILVIPITIAQGYRFGFLLWTNRTGQMSSVWFFWGFQVSMEILMTLIIIHTITRRFRSGKAGKESRRLRDALWAKSRAGREKTRSLNQVGFQNLGHILDDHDITRPVAKNHCEACAIRAHMIALGVTDLAILERGFIDPHSQPTHGDDQLNIGLSTSASVHDMPPSPAVGGTVGRTPAWQGATMPNDMSLPFSPANGTHLPSSETLSTPMVRMSSRQDSSASSDTIYGRSTSPIIFPPTSTPALSGTDIIGPSALALSVTTPSPIIANTGGQSSAPKTQGVPDNISHPAFPACDTKLSSMGTPTTPIVCIPGEQNVVAASATSCDSHTFITPLPSAETQPAASPAPQPLFRAEHVKGAEAL